MPGFGNNLPVTAQPPQTLRAGGPILNEFGGINQPFGQGAFGGLLDAISRGQAERQGRAAATQENTFRQTAGLPSLLQQNQAVQAQAERQAIEARKKAQRDALIFNLDVQKKLIDLQTAGLNQQDLLRNRATGFKSREDELETSLTIQNLNETLRSVEAMQKLRQDLGTLGPIDRFANPDAFATVQQFMFDKINLFKRLAEDTRVSDEDREYYRSIGDVNFLSLLFNGRAVEATFLENLQARLTRTMDAYEFSYPELRRARPELFTRPDLNRDIGPTITRQPLKEAFDFEQFENINIGAF